MSSLKIAATSQFALTFTSFSVFKYYGHEAIEAFPDRLKRIANSVNNLDTTWKAEYNPMFDGHSSETVQNLMGQVKVASKAPLSEQEKQLRINMYEEAKKTHYINGLPTYFDAREAWPKCSSIGEIRDQSQCGSCWAVSSASVMSDRACIQSGGDKQYRVSAEDLMTCCPECSESKDPADKGGCFGGDHAKAFEHWVLHGIVTGDGYGDKNSCRAYKFPPCFHHEEAPGLPWCMKLLETIPNHDGFFNTPTCKRTCQESYGKKYYEDKRFGVAWYSLYSEREMAEDIMANGPINVSIELFEDFFTYRSGIYYKTPMSGMSHGFHAVRCIGFGTKDGVDYWIITNSWNQAWGDNGLFYLRRGTNEISVAEQPGAAIPDINS